MSHEVQTINTLWVYNGAEYEFDAEDRDCAEQYETAIRELEKKEKSMPKTGTVASRIDYYDSMIRDMFDTVFGPGKGDEILGETVNARNCDLAFESFVSFVAEQQKAIEKRQNASMSKFKTLSGNREQRRAAAKRNGNS